MSFICSRALSSSHLETMRAREIFRLFIGASLVTLILGHGMLIDPASRNSAWRFFPNRPAQYTDNELNCGGFSVQWSKNKGKCGVCGDAYHLKNPRYVYPGRYAKDRFVTKTYKEGQQIEVSVKITSNHQGFFRFSVGKVEKRPITQEQLKHILLQPDGSNTWPLHSSRDGVFKIKLMLPEGLTCDHCVVQWWWKVGNNWGCNDEGVCGEGLAKRQETFVNCADIRIVPAGGPAPSTEEPDPDTPMMTVVGTTQEPATSAATPKPPTGGCKATGSWTGQSHMNTWCQNNCALGNCPSSNCICS